MRGEKANRCSKITLISFFSISPPFVQISMNVAATMEAVHTHAPTQLVHSSAAVELDTHCQRMEGVAMVRLQFGLCKLALRIFMFLNWKVEFKL